MFWVSVILPFTSALTDSKLNRYGIGGDRPNFTQYYKGFTEEYMAPFGEYIKMCFREWSALL